MAKQIFFVLAETYGLRIYAIMLPSSDFSVAHYLDDLPELGISVVFYKWLLKLLLQI